jgi:hypothetical protein
MRQAGPVFCLAILLYIHAAGSTCVLSSHTPVHTCGRQDLCSVWPYSCTYIQQAGPVFCLAILLYIHATGRTCILSDHTTIPAAGRTWWSCPVLSSWHSSIRCWLLLLLLLLFLLLLQSRWLLWWYCQIAASSCKQRDSFHFGLIVLIKMKHRRRLP